MIDLDRSGSRFIIHLETGTSVPPLFLLVSPFFAVAASLIMILERVPDSHRLILSYLHRGHGHGIAWDRRGVLCDFCTIIAFRQTHSRPYELRNE